ncbi:hypothetical protein [Proteiniphilum sp. UBA5463]|jgi:hypothetical protein|uniref:hypothetical protein n=1 Tax=Proteiniphilum sp. UBA5463 TaxID=1947281 RepID=UPI00257AADDA|nr:hypothetical protein [Proteiniphilum sp. UBA5463]
MKTEITGYDLSGCPEYEHGLIICECNDVDHCIIYKKDVSQWDGTEIRENHVYMNVSLASRNNFFERLKLAFQYLFKKERYGGMYGEIIISKDNISGLEDIVNFINDQNTNK